MQNTDNETVKQTLIQTDSKMKQFTYNLLTMENQNLPTLYMYSCIAHNGTHRNDCSVFGSLKAHDFT